MKETFEKIMLDFHQAELPVPSKREFNLPEDYCMPGDYPTI